MSITESAESSSKVQIQENQEPLDTLPAYSPLKPDVPDDVSPYPALKPDERDDEITPPSSQQSESTVMQSTNVRPAPAVVDNSYQYNNNRCLIGNIIEVTTSSVTGSSHRANTPPRTVSGFVDGYIAHKSERIQRKRKGLIGSLRKMAGDFIMPAPPTQQRQYVQNQQYLQQQQQQQLHSVEYKKS